MSPVVTVVGAGFAGVEAAWLLARHGVPVRLVEMRPTRLTPAHTTGYFAELVCSNSLKSKNPDCPAGQLKTEMRCLGSLVLSVADRHALPGGEALVVDRNEFGKSVTESLRQHPKVEVVEAEWNPSMVDGPTIIATGPLSSAVVSEWLAEQTGRDRLYFYDAVSPVVDAETIDRRVVFAQSRYDKGGDDYLNCPFEKDSYERFVAELVTAERVPIHAFEAGGNRSDTSVTPEEQFIDKVKYFAGCMPIEVIAEKGARSLAFGNFKPIGLTDPRTGRRPYAALQLRVENAERTLYSLVACQNRLRFGEQKRIFRLVPGLESAEFVRYGVIHRNTYLDAPRVLSPDLELVGNPGVRVAGQLTGVEGYVESAASGIMAGLYTLLGLRGLAPVLPPRETALGSLSGHLQDRTPKEFAPMNINWGLLPEIDGVRDKGKRREMKLAVARATFDRWHVALLESGFELAS